MENCSGESLILVLDQFSSCPKSHRAQGPLVVPWFCLSQLSTCRVTLFLTPGLVFWAGRQQNGTQQHTLKAQVAILLAPFQPLLLSWVWAVVSPWWKESFLLMIYLVGLAALPLLACGGTGVGTVTCQGEWAMLGVGLCWQPSWLSHLSSS